MIILNASNINSYVSAVENRDRNFILTYNKTTGNRFLSLLIVSLFLLSGLFTVLLSFPSLEVEAATIQTSGTRPTNGEIITGIYSFRVNDNGSATGCDLYIDGVLVAALLTTGVANPDWQRSLDTSGWSDGDHLIRYQSYGGTGGDDIFTISAKFDNNGPDITNRTAVYNSTATAVHTGDTVRVRATIVDSVSGVKNATCNATSIGGPQFVQMYDDGQHQDGSAADDIYGSDEITVNAIPGYHSVFIWAQDNKGNFNNKTVEVDVDNFEPTIREIQTVLPAGQTGVKNGDQVRIIATALDFKLEIINVVVRQPLDVVLALDNSGSMRGIKWASLETAAKAFIDTLADGDRVAIYSFNLQGGYPYESVKQYQPFLQMDQVYNCPNCEITDIGRNLSKHVITIDDGVHLTNTNGDPGCFTPIWDTIGEAIIYAQNNHLTTHVPVVIAMTDGDDWGSGGMETGSETFCPGAPNGGTGRTWTISGGCYWGSPVRSYSTIQRERDLNLFNSYTSITFTSSVNRDGTRTGLINCSIPIFSIGLGNYPQGSNSSASGYLNPSTNNYKYTTEFDLREIGESSAGGKYYYAPSGNELNQIYQTISQEIQKFGIQELGKTAPHGIQKLEADLSSLGIAQKISMFDDGLHGDASANDDIYGSAFVTVNSVNTGKVVFSVEGTDIAGNTNYTINSIYLDNIQPVIDNITAYYPPGRTTAQDGYSIYFSATTNDTESGLGFVYLDASNIGGGSSIPMNDAGDENDLYAFDGVYTSKNFTVATGLKSGTYTVTIKSFDKAGNMAKHSGNIEINNDVDIIMGNLVANEVISGNYNIIVNITDPDGIIDTATQPRYRIDANPWYDLAFVSGTNYDAIINTSLYLDGIHTIYVNAKDPYGAESTLETIFYIDNTPPSEVTIIAPIKNEFIWEDYHFKCTAIDAIGINNVTVTITNLTGVEVVANKSMGFNSGVGYYEFVLGTSNLPDGEYNITTYARDLAGHEKASETIVFYIDNNDPSLILNHPKDNDIVSGIVVMNLTVEDMFLKSIQYNVDNSGWFNITVPWNTTSISDGSHSMRIKVLDRAGHEVLETITVIVDNNLPDCSVYKPFPNEFIQEDYTLKAYAYDNVGIESVNVLVNHVEQINATNISITEIINTTMVYNSVTAYYEYNFDTTILPDGNYTIICWAKDLAKNVTTTSNVTFYIDNHYPEFTINDPYEGKIVSGLFEFNITLLNETFPDWVRYNIDGSGWVDIGILWDTTQLLDGTHTIELRAKDLAGHFVDETLTVIVDNNNPQCNVIAPVPNQYIEGIFTFKVAASDLVEINKVTISVFNENVNATYNTQTSSYEYSVDTTVYGDGSRYMVATVYDSSGKSITSVPVPFHVDNHAPVLILNSPVDGEYVWGEVMINVSVQEIFLDKIEYNVDGKGWTSVGVPWDTTVLKDGKHIVQVRAKDNLGHATEQIINIIVDNHDPVCVIQAPIDNQYIENTFTFKILALDEVGIESVELLVFYGTINAVLNSQSGYYEYSIDTRFLEDGKYNITAVCRDLANRTTTADMINFRVDNTYPDLQVNSPMNGVYVTGEVEIDLKISDTFPCVTEYNVDGNGWIPYQIKPVWNSTSVLDGEHEIEIRTKDPPGHTSEHKLVLYVDNYAPSCAIHAPAKDQFIEDTFTFKILALDVGGIDSVMITIFSEVVKTTYNSQTNYYEYTVATNAIPDGIYNISVITFDRSGKSTDIGPIDFNVDNNAPILMINSPISNEFVSGNKLIELEVIDVFPTTTYYNVDGSGWITTDVPWATRKGSDGEHTLEIRAVDAAGHSIEQTLSVNVDNTPPKISVVLPKENDYISGIYIVKVYASDIFGVESVKLRLDNSQPMEISQNPSSGLYELPIDTTKLNMADGEHKLIVEAEDKVFQISNATLTIFIDNSPPVIRLNYPKTGVSRVDIVVNATDLSGIDKVFINIDGTGWQELNSFPGKNNTFRHIWRTKVSDNGYHQFEIKTIDNMGNEDISSGELTISNEEEEEYFNTLLKAMPLIIFIFILILTIIVFVLFKRGTFSSWLGRGEGKTKTEEGDEEAKMDEELDEEDEFDFEFARGEEEEGFDEGPVHVDDLQHRVTHEPRKRKAPKARAAGPRKREAHKPRKPKKEKETTEFEVNEADIDWFEEEKPPSIIDEPTKTPRKKPPKRRSGEHPRRRREEQQHRSRPSKKRRRPK